MFFSLQVSRKQLQGFIFWGSTWWADAPGEPDHQQLQLDLGCHLGRDASERHADSGRDLVGRSHTFVGAWAQPKRWGTWWFMHPEVRHELKKVWTLQLKSQFNKNIESTTWTSFQLISHIFFFWLFFFIHDKWDSKRCGTVSPGRSLLLLPWRSSRPHGRRWSMTRCPRCQAMAIIQHLIYIHIPIMLNQEWTLTIIDISLTYEMTWIMSIICQYTGFAKFTIEPSINQTEQWSAQNHFLFFWDIFFFSPAIQKFTIQAVHPNG